MPKSLTMVFSQLFNNGSWNVLGVMPKVNDIKVVLARKKVDICGTQESKTDSVGENKTAPLTIYSWKENETKNWEWHPWSENH